MRRFLTFVVEGVLADNGHAGDLKESVIGMAVFDRDAYYDPKNDPVVRVEARRLRSKLEEYYQGPGKQDAIRIEIPKGSYAAIWQWQNQEEPPEVPNRSHQRWPQWILTTLLAAAVLTVLALLWTRIEARRLAEGSHTYGTNKIHSLAILPFRNISGDSSQEYLCAGLTDEITTDLAKIRTLKVISRTSADQYRTTTKRLPEIARELNVDAVVEGTFLSSSNRVRVSAQLIRAATDTHLWADSYQRNGNDLFILQTEIAGNIAREVGATLKPPGEIAATPPVNPNAYDLYLRGRYLWNQRTRSGLEKSVSYYNRAVQIDPAYAKVYAALGESYVVLSTYGGPTPAEWLTRARSSAQQALRLDPSLAEAHTVLAAVKVAYDRDWQTATAEYQQAIKLNPNYPTAHHWYSLHLSRLGRHAEAKEEIQRALDLDPLSRIINIDAGETFYWAREPDQALLALQRAVELDPNFAQVHVVLGKVYEQKRDFEQALAEFKRADELLPDSPTTLAFIGHALALAGKREQALAIATKLNEISKHHYVSNITLAFLYCALEDSDSAMAWLEKSYREPGESIDFIGAEPLFDGCRSDPRFQALLQRLNLPQ